MIRRGRTTAASPTDKTVYSVTSAPESLASDKAERMRRYIISMSIRTMCFVLAIFLTGPVRWVCVLLACVLPYVAVVMANAARVRRVGTVPIVPPPVRPQAALPHHDDRFLL